jgi:hypothetical protein
VRNFKSSRGDASGIMADEVLFLSCARPVPCPSSHAFRPAFCSSIFHLLCYVQVLCGNMR